MKKSELDAIKEIDDALNAPRKDHKIKITTLVGGDVLDKLKSDAEKRGIPYQTLINSILTQYCNGGLVSRDTLDLLKDLIMKEKIGA